MAINDKSEIIAIKIIQGRADDRKSFEEMINSIELEGTAKPIRVKTYDMRDGIIRNKNYGSSIFI